MQSKRKHVYICAHVHMFVYFIRTWYCAEIEFARMIYFPEVANELAVIRTSACRSIKID